MTSKEKNYKQRHYVYMQRLQKVSNCRVDLNALMLEVNALWSICEYIVEDKVIWRIYI